MENMAKSLKSKEMAEIAMRNQKAQSYGEGYADGFSAGYDKALDNVAELANKYLYGEKADENAELKPAIHFLGDSIKSLIDKIVEECDEVVQAFNDGEKPERIAEEIGDVQLACETALAGLGYHEKERRKIRLANIQKNTKRGYYTV
jgi:NTP pyrophosphatase (non-canonical NTP hydrolase)